MSNEFCTRSFCGRGCALFLGNMSLIVSLASQCSTECQLVSVLKLDSGRLSPRIPPTPTPTPTCCPPPPPLRGVVVVARAICCLHWRAICCLHWRTICCLHWRTICCLHCTAMRGGTGSCTTARALCKCKCTVDEMKALVSLQVAPIGY